MSKRSASEFSCQRGLETASVYNRDEHFASFRIENADVATEFARLLNDLEGFITRSQPLLDQEQAAFLRWRVGYLIARHCGVALDYSKMPVAEGTQA